VIRSDPSTLNASQTKLFIRGHNATKDDSPGNKTITNNGGVTVVDAPGGHPYARSAGYFDGANAYLTATDSPDWQLGGGTGAFTIRGWVYIDSFANYRCIAGQLDSGTLFWNFIIYDGTTIRFENYSGGVDTVITAAHGFALNTFNLVELVRIDNGNTSASWRIFVNGVAKSLTLVSGTWNHTTADCASVLGVGIRGNNNAYPMSGYMCDVEIANTARHTADYTLPTAPLVADANTKLLLPMDKYLTPTTFTDISPSPKTITRNGNAVQALLPPGKKALSFTAASGQYLSTTNLTGFDYGRDYTMDCWVKLPTTFQTGHLMGQIDNGSVGPAIAMWVHSNGDYLYVQQFNVAGGFDIAGIVYTVPVTLKNVWIHLATVRYGNLLSLYVNGVLVRSGTCAGTWVNPATFFGVGSVYNSAPSNVKADMMNTRYSSFARWTKNFIPPTKY